MTPADQLREEHQEILLTIGIVVDCPSRWSDPVGNNQALLLGLRAKGFIDPKSKQAKEERIMVYEKIMVPLDGSELAECVLPHVEALAKGCHVKEVTFVRVFEPFRPPSSGEMVWSNEEIARLDSTHKAAVSSYLQKLTERFRVDGVGIRGEMLNGRVADTLADYAVEKKPDLIVIATHGRSGVSRWVWGSVADRLLRSSCVPVLMVRAPGCVPGI
jgi:nucleotide-binding universal stress UspA family protein